MELQFARKHPELVAQEHFLKPLAPLFCDGIKKIDWNLAEKQLKTILKKLFTESDFSKFSGAGDVHLFVVAKNKKTESPLGLIQFLITPDYEHGTVKAAYYGVLSTEHGRAIEKLLMSAIFKLLPIVIKRIFLHTRTTNEKAIKLYYSWGFSKFPGELTNWTNVEYKADQSHNLQKTAAMID